MPNVIKQIVNEGADGTQTIKMIVRDNERGPQGEKGDTGTAATIEAGNAYTVPNGHAPAVINTGSSSSAKFDFYIPKGDKGDQGIPGQDGVVQYTAGAGIRIKNNVISAIGGGAGDVEWGDILGTISDQTDLQNELNTFAKASTLSTVATTGLYDDLLDKPTIPAAQVQSNWNQTNSSAVDYIKNKPTVPKAGQAKVLTQSDYNYPATNNDGVALWLLPSGIYVRQSSAVKIYFDASHTENGSTIGTYIVGHYEGGASARTNIIIQHPSETLINYVYTSSGTPYSGSGHVLQAADIVNNLTSTNATLPLSAAQGKELKTLIDNLDIPTITMTTTDPGEGSALAENNFIAVYSAS